MVYNLKAMAQTHRLLCIQIKAMDHKIFYVQLIAHKAKPESFYPISLLHTALMLEC
jgi:hypothetical protein